MENGSLIKDVNVGHVVLADYLDFEGNIREGMFVVIGVERHSKFVQLEAIKISTTKGSFQVLLESKYLNCLHYDSYINCTDIQKISGEQCKSILGKLSSGTIDIVKKQVNNAWKYFYDQMDEYIAAGNKHTESYSDNPNRDVEIKLGDSNNLIIDGKNVPLDSILKALRSR